MVPGNTNLIFPVFAIPMKFTAYGVPPKFAAMGVPFTFGQLLDCPLPLFLNSIYGQFCP